MSSQFDWDKLRVFYFVAKHLSFSKAAIKLYTTQSSLSRKIIILERQLKVQLFYRNSRGLEMTEAGKEWYELAKKFILELERAQSMNNSNQPRGIFRISSTRGALENWLSLILGKLIKQYPNVDFEFIGHFEELDLFSGEANVAIFPTQKRQEGLSYKHLFDRHWGLFASEKYLEQYGEPKTVEDLNHHKIIGMAPTFQYYPQDHDKNLYSWPLTVGLPEGQKRKPVFVSNSDHAINNAAREGIGIFTAMRDWYNGKAGFQLVLPQLTKTFSYYYVHPEQVKEVGFIKDLYEFIKENS